MEYRAEMTLAESAGYDGGSLIATVRGGDRIGCVYTAYREGDGWFSEDDCGDFFMDICNGDWEREYTVYFGRQGTDSELEETVRALFGAETGTL